MLRSFLLCSFIYSPLLSSRIGPNGVLTIAFPDTFLAQETQPVPTLFVIIFISIFFSILHNYVPYEVFLSNKRTAFNFV